MKLGGKSRDVDSFVDQLKEEGETVAAKTSISTVPGAKITPTVSDSARTEPYELFNMTFTCLFS